MKKVSLQNALTHASHSQAPQSTRKGTAKRADDAEKTSREGKKAISAWFDPQVALQLQEIALKKSKTNGSKVLIQDVIREAYNDLFAKYKLPEIA